MEKNFEVNDIFARFHDFFVKPKIYGRPRLMILGISAQARTNEHPCLILSYGSYSIKGFTRVNCSQTATTRLVLQLHGIALTSKSS